MMFNWFKPSEKLHGMNLSKWHYLGWTYISMYDQYQPNDKGFRGDIHYFVSKDNLLKRKYIIKCSDVPSKNNLEKYHRFVTTIAALWKINEYPLYHGINCPSIWLKEHMLTTFNCTWNEQVLAWANRAISQASNNVVSVDFTKR